MRDFFINAFDKLVGVIVVLGAVGVVIAAFVSAMGQGGLLTGGLILISGTLYLVLIGGGMYLGLGIYHNTRRMAETMERTESR